MPKSFIHSKSMTWRIFTGIRQKPWMTLWASQRRSKRENKSKNRAMRRYILIIPLMLLVHSLAMGQDVSSQSQRVDKLNKDIAYIDNLLKANASKQKATSQQLSLLRKKVANRKDIISEMDGEISGFDRQIALKNQEIADLQSELDTLEEYYNRLIYNTYKNRDTKVWFMYILASENIGQGYRRFAYLKNLSNVVNNQVNNIKGTQADLESEKKELNI